MPSFRGNGVPEYPTVTADLPVISMHCSVPGRQP
jgi:hypothetical protein